METKIKKKKSSRKLRKWHKWVGIFFTFFLFMFAFSGIFLNHRRAVSSWDIPRKILHADYQYKNWNNGSVKNTIKLSSDSILVYGNNGIWLTDIHHNSFMPFSKGLRKGADNNTVNNIIRTKNNDLYAITTFDIYKLENGHEEWHNISHLVDSKERLTDIAICNDTLVLMTRSCLFISEAPFIKFEQKELLAPVGYAKKASLFRTMWTLHSGELFGITGKVIVDIIGILVIILCVTGIILMFCPSFIKRGKHKGKPVSHHVKLVRKSLKWHNKVGAWFIVLFLFSCITGMFLRPPLLIGIVRTTTKPVPGSVLDSENPWFDKLRCLRYDEMYQDWILYSSEGFFNLKTLESEPEKILKSPPVSVMGVTVMEPVDTTRWIVGSFSGIYYWDRQSGDSFDFYTGEKYVRKRGGMPTFSNAVSGYSDDFENKQVVFEYGHGAKTNEHTGFADMPRIFHEGRMSFWHLCLEIHVGRIYSPILGVVSDMFVFLSGIFYLVILITGYVIYRRHFRKRKQKKADL